MKSVGSSQILSGLIVRTETDAESLLHAMDEGTYLRKGAQVTPA